MAFTDRRMNRRAMLKQAGTAMGASLLVGAVSGRGAADESPKQRPNIVFVIADDMGWADIGYHGSEIKTPHLDGLAAAGVRFDQFYATPTCTPTRVGLMTGRYPSRYGVVSPAYGDIFDDDTVTVAGALAGYGYTTHISGKWHMGSPPDCVPRKYGFTTSYGYFDGQIDPYTHKYKTGRACWHRNDELLAEEGHATDLITDEAVRVIESSGEQPFFLYVAYSVPHYPLEEPERWVSMYEGVIENESRRWFAASVTHMDDGIGKIVAALDKAGKRANTLFVFVSDNGGQQSWHSDKHYDGKYADKAHDVLGNNEPLRGWKGQVYEGGIRVPALANWPGVLKPGKVEAPVHVVDWMPTLCAVAVPRPLRNPAWDGVDVMPLILGSVQGGSTRTMYWKTPGQTALREGAWKLVVDKDGENAELYDLAADPLEQRDLAKEEPERVARLLGLMEAVAEKDRARR